MKDWYNVTLKSFLKAGGGGLYKHYNSMTNLLSNVYPQYHWFHLERLCNLFSLGILQIFEASPYSEKL